MATEPSGTARPGTTRSGTPQPSTDVFVTGARRSAPAGTDLAAAHATPEKPKSKAELRADAARARADLAGTLDAIELKLNLPYQAKLRRRRFRMSVQKLQDDNPLALVGIAAGAVAIVAGTVWLGVKAIRER